MTAVRGWKQYARAVVWAVVCALCTDASGAAETGGLTGQPRPLSDAERTAVQYAAEFLASGPQALHDRLSTTSPLKLLPQAEALREIEVRTGPSQGARWALQTVVPSLKDRTVAFSITFPSGIDDTILFDLANEEGVYRIERLRVLAEPPDGTVLEESDDRPAADPTSSPHRATLALGFLALGLCTAGTFFSRFRLFSWIMLACSAALMLPVYGWSARQFVETRKQATTGTSVPAEAPADIARLGDLLELRTMITTGRDLPTFTGMVGNRKGTEQLVSAAWKAQAELLQMRSEDAERTLARLPDGASSPLIHLLRGRIAIARSNGTDATLAYERAMSLGPGRDELWYEAAGVFSLLGFDERAETLLRRLDRIGSRRASVYFDLALNEAGSDRLAQSEKLAVAAWNIEPLDRTRLIESAGVWDLLRRPSFAALIQLHSAVEPPVTSAELSTRPMRLPAGAHASVCGDTLLIEIGPQTLHVVGGAVMAPAATAVEDAVQWKERNARRALERFPELVEATRAGGAGAFLQPALSQNILETAMALADRNRWSDLCDLTEGLKGSEEQIPFGVLALRGLALRRAGRLQDAKGVILALAVNPALKRNQNPYEFMVLAEMLASVKLYDAAIRMLDRAGAIHEFPHIDDRARNFAMRQRLASGYSSVLSEHFEIHYPEEAGAPHAVRLGQILEAERKRLGKVIPLQSSERIVVNMVWWDEFRSTLTLNDYVVGFFDGEITVPVVGIPYVPPVVQVLSHELAHALIAQATNDQAPHWFHEGLAQRVEMTPYHANAFNMYDNERMFTLALLDPILTHSPDPEMVKQGYILSQTVIRFIEDQYGAGAIQRFMTAFRSGAGTEEAIQVVTGGNHIEFDRRFRAWGFAAGSRVFENAKPLRYDLGADVAKPEARPPALNRKPTDLPSRKGRAR